MKNPGIPYTVSIIKEATNRGLKILTEVELSYLISEAPIIAVTGTNGKTTVTSLIGDMFQKRVDWTTFWEYWLCSLKSCTRS